MSEIERQIQRIDEKIEALNQQRKQLVKIKTRILRNSLDRYMLELLGVIGRNPGIGRDDLMKKTHLTTEANYMNTMTSLRRRGLIVNKGTRHTPKWHCT